MLGYRQSGSPGKFSPVPATRKELNTNFSGRMKGNRTRIISYTPLTILPSPFFINDFNGVTIETLPGVLYTHNTLFIEDFNGETIETLLGVLYTHNPLFIEDFNGETIGTLPGVLYTQNLVFIEDFNGETIGTLPGVLYTQL